MGKRKDLKDADDDVRMGENDSDSDSEVLDMINVDVEMFDPQPAHDFHGIKNLLRQLFDADSMLFDLSALTDLILSQPLLGTTIKVDGNESDPFAFLTVINLNQHKDNPAIKTLTSYLRTSAASSNEALADKLNTLLSEESPGHLGLILTERLINLPTETVPPMYKMLLEEIEWAVQDGEPYTFSAFAILSKTYTEVASKLDEEDRRPLKKGKKKYSAKKEMFYFHPEDETIQRSGISSSWKYQKEGDSADSKRAFSEAGIEPMGHLILLDVGELPKVVQDLESLFKP